MKKTKYKTTFKEILPTKPGRKPKMEIWHTIPEGFQNAVTGRTLTPKAFEAYQYSLQGQNVGLIIKSLNHVS